MKTTKIFLLEFIAFVVVIASITAATYTLGKGAGFTEHPPIETVIVGQEKVMPEFEIQNVVMTFYLFETLEDLREELGEDALLGLSDCEWKEDMNISYCDIYSVRPQHVDDEATCTIGHEVMHAIYGKYHSVYYGYDRDLGCK